MHANRFNEKRMALEAKTFFLRNRGKNVVEAIEEGIPPIMLWSVCDAINAGSATSDRTKALMERIRPGFEVAAADAFNVLPAPLNTQAVKAAGWMVVDAFEIPAHGRKPASLITAAVTVTNTLLDSGFLVLPVGHAFEASVTALIDDFNDAAAYPATADIFARAVPSGQRLAKKMLNSFNRFGFYRGMDQLQSQAS